MSVWTAILANIATVLVTLGTFWGAISGYMKRQKEALTAAMHQLEEYKHARVAERLNDHNDRIEVHNKRIYALEVQQREATFEMKNTIKDGLQELDDTNREGRAKIHQHIEAAKQEINSANDKRADKTDAKIEKVQDTLRAVETETRENTVWIEEQKRNK
jgi:hypothetical protein